jgi:hypothetical protein
MGAAVVTADAAPGVPRRLTERKIVAHLPGGDLELEWRQSDNNVYMTGPATELFRGQWQEQEQSEACGFPLIPSRWRRGLGPRPAASDRHPGPPLAYLSARSTGP